MLLQKPVWKLQDAKAQLSKLVRDALAHGPQFISRRGEKTVVVLSIDEYEKLVQPKPSLAKFLLNAPKIATEDFEFERVHDEPRDTNL